MSFKSALDKMWETVNDSGSHHAKKNSCAKVTLPVTSPGTATISIGTPSATTSGIYATIGSTGTIYTGGTGYSSSGTILAGPSTTYTHPVFSASIYPSMPMVAILTLYNDKGQKIVQLEKDGTVTWDKEIDVDEAAKAFQRALTISGEQSIGITAGVKSRMRDSVFNDLIEIAKEKGSLTSEDLTYLLSASKIVEKLKGKE